MNVQYGSSTTNFFESLQQGWGSLRQSLRDNQFVLITGNQFIRVYKFLLIFFPRLTVKCAQVAIEFTFDLSYTTYSGFPLIHNRIEIAFEIIIIFICIQFLISLVISK